MQHTKFKILSIIYILISFHCIAQKPCSLPEFRAFDFWIGEWEVFSPNQQKAGESKITLILDSCVILEEWTSANKQQGILYKGKSFSKYNPATQNWQQTWVDNVGGSIEFLRGSVFENKVVFIADNVYLGNSKKAKRQLSFYSLSKDKIRQHGELSTDDGVTWQTEYDLEYRRKK